MNAENFTKLYHAHYGLLYFWLLSKTKNKEQAEDLASTAFMKAWNSRNRLKNAGKFKQWLYQIAMNELRLSYRIPAFVELLEDVSDPQDHAQTLESALESQKMIQACPRVLKQFSWGQNVKELAREYSVPVGTILSRLHTARQETKRRLCHGLSVV